jgi:hypothetical protein
MRYLSRGIRPIVGLVFLGLCPLLLAEQPAPVKKADKKPVASKFLRIKRDDNKQPVALETAITRYVPASGEGKLEVDLIGAVHVGDKAYYEALNKALEKYDVLLYELVAPPGTKIPKGGRKKNDNPLAMMQQMAKVVLELELQLEQVDYTKKNFVHADMSPDDMAAAIKKRGDDGVTIALGVVADMLRQQNLEKMKDKDAPKDELPDLDLADLLLDPNRAVKLKRIMAQQFEKTDEGAFGKTIGTILIEDRNKAALKVFQQQLAKGKKKIGIFYGAAHMPDFEKRLRDDFDLKKDSEQWLQAWDLKMKAKKNGIEDLLRKLLEE